MAPEGVPSVTKNQRDASTLRVLVINSGPFYKLGDQYYSIYSWTRFPELLSKKTAGVTVWAPVTEIDDKDDVPVGSFRVDTARMDIVDSGTYRSFFQYLARVPRNQWRWRRQAKMLVAGHDVVIHRVPAPQLSLMVGTARRLGKPIFLMIAGDVRTQSEPLYSNSVWKRLLYQLGTRFIQWRQISLARHAERVYAFSGVLCDKFKKGNPNTSLGRTPHISQSGFFIRSDTCGGDTVFLLRVCWLQRSKGLEDLLAAFAELRSRGRDVSLRIVGAQRSAGYLASLEALSARLGVQDRVEFVGWVSLDAIPEMYRNSDIHVLSSTSEGMPRCVMEAGASGLPQVVTAVGGCPDVLTDGKDALLVAPGQPLEMANAIERVIDDRELRKTLIRNGYLAAEKGTFEVEGARILKDLVNAVGVRANNGAAAFLKTG